MNMFAGKIIFMVTCNINKFNEARSILREYNISVAMLKLKINELQDDSIENIARARAAEALSKVNLPLIVEDAGLFIDALNGFPGPYSSYVYRTIGVEGILRLMDGCDNRKAEFRSAVVFSSPNGDMKCFMGISKGTISEEVRGESGFGFDPIFKPEGGGGRTFGEMSITEKSLYSHRAKALKRFAEYYKSLKRSF